MQNIRSRRASNSASLNFRIEVFHRGINLATSVMARADLRILLDITGYLQVATFEQWIEVIIEGLERPKFCLDARGSVIYYVTPTDERATHNTRSIH